MLILVCTLGDLRVLSFPLVCPPILRACHVCRANMVWGCFAKVNLTEPLVQYRANLCGCGGDMYRSPKLGVCPPCAVKTCVRRDYHQSFMQPDFREEKKSALSGNFLLIFLCLRPKRARKNLRQTLVTSGMRVSLVKVLFKCAVRPVFAWVVGELRAADRSKCPRAHEAKC